MERAISSNLGRRFRVGTAAWQQPSSQGRRSQVMSKRSSCSIVATDRSSLVRSSIATECAQRPLQPFLQRRLHLCSASGRTYEPLNLGTVAQQQNGRQRHHTEPLH
jgi:hypothetical protein